MAEPIRDAVLDLLGKAIVASDRSDAEQAVAWVVLSRDDQYGTTTLYGPFETEMEAAVWADRHYLDVHRGHPPGEPGWTVSTLPLLSKD